MTQTELIGNENLIFIPGNTPSLKNSKVKTARGIFSSTTVKKYLRNLGIQNYSNVSKDDLSARLMYSTVSESISRGIKTGEYSINANINANEDKSNE